MDQRPQAAILIIDDDANVRRLLHYALKRAGYVIYEAEDGFQGLEMYTQYQPDIVLLDALMPRLDGFEVCAKLRELPCGDQVPILMVTALEDAKSIDRAFEAGATDYITKPINQTVLSHRIRHLLLTRRAQRQVYFKASLLDQVRNAVVATDEQGKITYCNKAAELLFQWGPLEVIGQPIQEIISSPGDRALFESILADAEQIGFWEGELNIQDKNGTSFPTQMSLNITRNTQGERIGFVAVLTDISERVRVEQACGHTHANRRHSSHPGIQRRRTYGCRGAGHWAWPFA